jgi:hypothetical protein
MFIPLSKVPKTGCLTFYVHPEAASNLQHALARRPIAGLDPFEMEESPLNSVWILGNLE